MAVNVDKIVKKAVKEIIEAFRVGQVQAAAASYEAQSDAQAFCDAIRDGLIEAGIPRLFVDRIIRRTRV